MLPLQDDGYFLQNNTVSVVNLVFATVLLAGAFGTWVVHVRHIARANATGKRW